MGGGGGGQESENQKLTLNFHRYCEKLTSYKHKREFVVQRTEENAVYTTVFNAMPRCTVPIP